MSENPVTQARERKRMSSGAVVILAALGGFLLWKLAALWLAVFGAAVLAVLLSGAAAFLERRVGLRYSFALVATIAALALLIAGSLWLFGSQVSNQLAGLAKLLPSAFGEVQQWMSNSEGGQWLNRSLEAVAPDTQKVRAQLGTLLSSTTSMVGVVGLIIIGGIYFAVDPGLYTRGAIPLVPKDHRALAQETLTRCTTALRSWMLGQFSSMAAVGILTGLGLWAIGVPAVAGLALLTAGLCIIPIVGPILAVVPAALLGFTVSPQVALGVVALYVVVQQIEGNVLQPVIQKYAVELPPALLLFSLFGMGAMCGPLGVLLAAPMTVVAFVAAKRVYVGAVLDDSAFRSGADHSTLLDAKRT